MNFLNLRKSTVFAFILLFALTAAFADKSRFYQNGKVIDTMYVDSAEGLRVRDKPSLKSNRLCALQHRLPVKVVAIGKEETIDGITAPWVEILIPSYEWKNKNIQEFGWAFGGYLSTKQPEFQIPQNKEQLTKYLESSFWYLNWEYGGTGDCRYGYFENGKIYAVEQNWKKSNYYLNEMKYMSTFRAVSGKKYYSDEYSFWMAPSVYEKDKVQQFLLKKGTFEITNIDDYWFTNYGSVYDDDFVWEFIPNRIFLGKLGSGVIFDSSEMLYNKRMYAIIKGRNAIQWLADENALTDDFAKKCIEMGLSADETPYSDCYRSFWNPIMEEHQKKADEMK